MGDSQEDGVHSSHISCVHVACRSPATAVHTFCVLACNNKSAFIRGGGSTVQKAHVIKAACSI
eukprot:364503-Chlamydomonas_euryale.AAC.11